MDLKRGYTYNLVSNLLLFGFLSRDKDKEDDLPLEAS